MAPNWGVRSGDKVDRTTGTLTTSAVPGGVGAGVTSAIDVRDAADAQVVLAPMCLNGATGPFDLEIAVTCPPGSIAIVGATPSIILGYGVAGADGRFAMTIPNITVPLPFLRARWRSSPRVSTCRPGS